MSDSGYVHGYSLREATRLADQADTLAELLHGDTRYPRGSRVLECGCGVGAQTVLLAAASPEAAIVSVDISPASLEQAKARTEAAGYENVEFLAADVYELPFEQGSFDHVFICFVLEHLPRPAEALRCLRRVLRPGGSITAIEGDNGSWYCHPETPEARRTVECQNEIAARLGGDCLGDGGLGAPASGLGGWRLGGDLGGSLGARGRLVGGGLDRRLARRPRRLDRLVGRAFAGGGVPSLVWFVGHDYAP